MYFHSHVTSSVRSRSGSKQFSLCAHNNCTDIFVDMLFPFFTFLVLDSAMEVRSNVRTMKSKDTHAVNGKKNTVERMRE